MATASAKLTYRAWAIWDEKRSTFHRPRCWPCFAVAYTNEQTAKRAARILSQIKKREFLAKGVYVDVSF